MLRSLNVFFIKIKQYLIFHELKYLFQYPNALRYHNKNTISCIVDTEVAIDMHLRLNNEKTLMCLAVENLFNRCMFCKV